MSPILAMLLLGTGIGFVAGVSPGPVLTLVVAETLGGGWPRGAAVAAGPLLADGPIILVAVAVVNQLPSGLVPAVSIVGGLFLTYLGVTTALSARRANLPGTSSKPAAGGFVRGLLARGLSPNPYLFWFLVGGPVLVQASADGWQATLAFLVGYYAAIVGSNVGLALVLHRWMGRISRRVYRLILLVASVILAAYGVALLGRATGEVSELAP